MTTEPITIAILDDRKGARETLQNGVQPALPSGWSCVLCPLLEDYHQYPTWLLANGVNVLLLDQLLNEQQPDSERLVTYKGSDVMAIIRQQLPDFPIMIVTGNLEDADLQAAFADADSIVDRTELVDLIDRYVPRIERLASVFSRRNSDQLSRLGVLSERAAKGEATPVEISELKSIQIALSLPTCDGNVDSALNEVDRQLAELARIEQQLRSRLSAN